MKRLAFPLLVLTAAAAAAQVPSGNDMPPSTVAQPPVPTPECVPKPGRQVAAAQRESKDPAVIADLAYEALRRDTQRRGKPNCQTN